LVFLGKDFVVKRFQIHKGYAARFTPRLTQKSTAQPLALLLHGYGLVRLRWKFRRDKLGLIRLKLV
jgi:hypothetical protein